MTKKNIILCVTGAAAAAGLVYAICQHNKKQKQAAIASTTTTPSMAIDRGGFLSLTGGAEGGTVLAPTIPNPPIIIGAGS